MPKKEIRLIDLPAVLATFHPQLTILIPFAFEFKGEF